MHSLKSTCTLLLLAIAPALAITPPPPVLRVPPIGWETRIMPGFNPPIEYYLVYERGWVVSVEKQHAIVRSWGPKAFDVLKAMSEDAAWAGFRDDILFLMQEADSPEKAVLFSSEAEKLISDPEAIKKSADLYKALARLINADYGGYVKLLDAHLASASPEVRRSLVGVLTHQLGGEHGEECEAKLNAIAGTIGDDGVKEMIARAIAENNARKRAQEPMQKVLDAERGKEAQR